MTKDEALKLALEVLEYWDVHGKLHQPTEEAITAIKEALAQPEQTNIERHEENVQKFLGTQQSAQEPVAWPCLIAEADFSQDTVTLKMQCNDYKVSSGKHWLYTTPPQRTWVGLTDDDRVLIKHDANYNQFMTAGEYADRVQQLTEARLKDLNT